jgi:hypothetical protein
VSPRIAKKRGGRIDLTLEPAEADLLRDLPDQLRTVYESDTGDEARQRLFPRAYLDPTEEQAEQEWEALVHPDLLRGRLDALSRLTSSLAGGDAGRGDRVVIHLGPDDVSAWLVVLNDARLTLGVRLGVTDDLDLATLDPDDPNAPGLAAYGWLTYLEGELVEALLGDLPG